MQFIASDALTHSLILLLTILKNADIISGVDVPNMKKKGDNVIYNDGEIVVLNDPVIDAELFGTWNDDIDLNKFIPPISNLDVKCLMHVDRYCSKAMAHIKGLLIGALKDDCENCSIKDKESVGKIVASMWAHDSQMWKLFLTRFDSTDILKRII